MPECYRIDAERQLVISRGWGVVTNEEVIAHYERLRADPAFDPAYRQLIDLRDASDMQAADVTLETIARLRVFDPEARRALVAATLQQFGKSRLFADHADTTGQTVRAFLGMRAALAWLARPPALAHRRSGRHSRPWLVMLDEGGARSG